MILKNYVSEAGYQAASYGISVCNYLSTTLLEKVEALTRQQLRIFHVFRKKIQIMISPFALPLSILD